ncbi:MAG: hypothetical protein Q9217_002613 [Psora testacea]
MDKKTLDNVIPQCVDTGVNPDWGSLSGSVKAGDCVEALAQLQRKVGPDVQSRRVFYSNKTFHGQGPGGKSGWALPDGGQNEPGRGSCTAVVRILRDFADDSLPFAPPSTGYLPASGLPLATRTWAEVYALVNGVLDTCVRKQEKPGWAVLGEDIVVAFWPRGSFIDQAYGLDGTGGRHSTSATTTGPISGGLVETS